MSASRVFSRTPFRSFSRSFNNSSLIFKTTKHNNQFKNNNSLNRFYTTFQQNNTFKPKNLPTLLFAIGLGSTAVIGAAYYTNLDTNKRILSINGNSFWKSLDSSGQLRLSRLREHTSRLKQLLSLSPNSRILIVLTEYYSSLSEYQRTCLGIIAINAGVFLAWQLPPLQGFMSRWFLHDPLQKGRTITMITSVFSHKSFIHFAFNSIALYSLGTTASKWLDNPTRSTGLYQERSTARYEFLAFYLVGGLFSSLTSHVWSTRILLPRMLKEANSLISSSSRTVILPSLGASGAIYSCLAMTAYAYPDAAVALIFLPMVPIPILTGFGGMVALDIAGLLLKWRMFDHAAHLGGAFAGVWWFTYGHEYFEKLRKWLKSSGESSGNRKESRRLISL